MSERGSKKMNDFSNDNEAFKKILEEGYCTCDVCGIDIQLDSKDLVQCEKCELHFHKRCYGIHECATINDPEIDLDYYKTLKDKFVGFEMENSVLKLKIKVNRFTFSTNPIYEEKLMPVPKDWGEELRKEFEAWKEKYLGEHEDEFDYIDITDINKIFKVEEDL